MTLNYTEREEMSKLYMEKSHTAIQEAKNAVSEFPNTAVSKSYYSMFYAAQSALVAHGVAGLRKHKSVNSHFGELFVHTGRFPKDIYRTMGDYSGPRNQAQLE